MQNGGIGTHLLPLSARSPKALQSLARAYQNFLATPESDGVVAGCLLHGQRAAQSPRPPPRRDRQFAGATDGRAWKLSCAARLVPACRLAAGFPLAGENWFLCFPDRGANGLAWDERLFEQEAVFREVIERCDLAMRPYGDWSLLAELTATDAARSRLNEIDIIQPALFAIQVALAALWRSWGIEPQAVVGHSLGEVAAAYVAGALSLDDAVRVICHRSRLFKRTIGQGAMAAVELSIEEARRVLAGFEDRVSIAVSNSPTSTVLSGDPAALAAILEQLQRRDIFCRMVKVDFASHSPQMEPLRADLLQALEGLQPRAESVPIYSTVTGQISSGAGIRSALLGEEHAGAGALFHCGSAPGGSWA